MMKVSIGAQLKNMRLDKNYSQAEVAEKLNISRQTLSKWELDKSLPDLFLLKDLALIYDVSVDSLLELQKERIQILSTFTNEELSAVIAQQMSKEQSPTQEQIHFIHENFIEPLSKQAEITDDYLWVSTERNLIIPGRYNYLSHAATKDISREFLQLFSFYSFTIIFLTEHALYFMNAIDWLETQEYTVYPFSEMEFIVVGKMYQPTMDSRNSQALGYKTKNGNFGYYKLEKDIAEKLKNVLTRLDPNHEYLVLLENLSVLEFIRKYRSKRQYKEK